MYEPPHGSATCTTVRGDSAHSSNNEDGDHGDIHDDDQAQEKRIEMIPMMAAMITLMMMTMTQTMTVLMMMMMIVMVIFVDSDGNIGSNIADTAIYNKNSDGDQ